MGIKPGSFLNIRLEGRRVIPEPAPNPPDVFVELGRDPRKFCKKQGRWMRKGKRLLRDLGVEGRG